LNPEYGGSIFLRNIRYFLPDYRALYVRRQYFYCQVITDKGRMWLKLLHFPENEPLPIYLNVFSVQSANFSQHSFCTLWNKWIRSRVAK
jgi:hypothetical protein